MKNFLLIVLLFFFISSHAQLLYDELQPHNAEPIDLIYIGNQTEFIGVLSNSREMYISYDIGKSWTKFDSGPLLFRDSGDLVASIKQNAFNQYFFQESDVIYFLDNIGGSMDTLFYLEAANDLIFDFAPLNNGNTVVLSRIEYLLLDTLGNVIKSIENPRQVLVDILIGDADKHFFVMKNPDNLEEMGLIQFDSEFNLKDSFNFTSILPLGDIFYENSRLYSQHSFSEDGINWREYDRKIEGDFLVNSDGKITITTADSIFVSHDNGLFFEAYVNNVPFRIEDSFTVGTRGLVYKNDWGGHLDNFNARYRPYNHTCNTSGLYISENGINNWKHIKEELEIGRPYAHKVRAFNQDNVYLATCNNFDFFKHESLEDWNAIDQCDSSIVDLELFSDGTGVTQNGCITYDGGLSWGPGNLGVDNPVGMRIRHGNIYVGEPHRLFASYDKAKTWVNYEFSNFHIPLNRNFDITQNESILLSEEGWSYSGVNEVEFNQNVINQFDQFSYGVNGGIGALSTSPNGDSFYYVSSSHSFGPNGTSNYFYNYSHDGGATLEGVNSSLFASVNYIYVDHLDNVYFVSSVDQTSKSGRTVWMSSDGGQTWNDISPINNDFKAITDISVGFDNHIYISTRSTPILRSKSPVQNAHIPIISSTNNLINNSDVKLSPNPTNGIVHLYGSNVDDQSRINVYNTIGELVMTTKLKSDNIIDLIHLENGVYWLSSYSITGKKYCFKIVLSK